MLMGCDCECHQIQMYGAVEDGEMRSETGVEFDQINVLRSV